MFVFNSNHTGAVAEAAIVLAAVHAGLEVFKPLSEHSRADLVFEIGPRLYRVQCKSACKMGEVLGIRLVGCRHTPGAGYVRTGYTLDEIDLVAAYCAELGSAYLIPFGRIAPARSIQLRLSPALNNQRAAIHFAADYEFAGAVAQLARAPEWHSGGRGFESHQLHSLGPATRDPAKQRRRK